MKKKIAILLSVAVLFAIGISAFAAESQTKEEKLKEELVAVVDDVDFSKVTGAEENGLDGLFDKANLKALHALLDYKTETVDDSYEQIKPDTCSHDYKLDSVVTGTHTNRLTGETYTQTYYYYVCTKCGDSYVE